MKDIINFIVIFFLFTGPSWAQLEFSKYYNNPVLIQGESGEWDSETVQTPSIIYDGIQYKMWFLGVHGKNRIGYATSPDGIHWIKYANNPVLDTGQSGEWDSESVASPTVIYVNGQYKMWYTGDNGSDHNRIGLSTSNDGIHWTKYSGNPVLQRGDSDSWESWHVQNPTVIYDGSTYKMWYEGLNDTYRIGYATSSDGIHWQKYSGNPVLDIDESSSWENGAVGHPSVIFDNNQYIMFYQGSGHGLNPGWQIGMAFSNDGIHWQKYVQNPVIPLGDSGEWDDAHVVAPSAILVNGNYKVWYGGYQYGGGHWEIGYASSMAEGEFQPDQYTVALYHFNEGSGTTIHDASGNGNDGTIHGATWTTEGKFGDALSFDGNSYIDIDNDIDLKNEATFEAWVKANGNPEARQVYTIVAKFENDYDEAKSYYFGIMRENNGNMAIYGEIGRWNAIFEFDSGLPWDNNWHHVAVEFADGKVTGYLDGKKIGEISVGSSSIPNTNQSTWIGVRGGPYGGLGMWYFNGIIDEVRISNIARHLAQAATIHLTSPNGGESWQLSSTHDITWTSAGITGNVKIELYKNEAFYKTIIGSTENDGIYSWNIPPTLGASNAYKIKISSIDDSSIFDLSDADFSIQAVQSGSFITLNPSQSKFQYNNKDFYFVGADRKSTRLNSSHTDISRMPSSA